MCSPVELILLQGRYCISPAKLCLAPFFVQGSSGSGAFLSYIMHTVMYTFFFFASGFFIYWTVSKRAARQVTECMRAPQRPTLVLGGTS